MMAPKGKGVDPYYTPQLIADELASALPSSLSGVVFDPAMGEGALLEAVERRFGDQVRLAGLDVDRQVVRKVRAQRPNWIIGSADFLEARSRVSSAPWKLTSGLVGAVVMNPPFSFRGNAGFRIVYGDFDGLVTPAMHFVAEALTWFQPEAGFFLILPDGALDAERNLSLWEQISKAYRVDRVAKLRSSSFQRARVSTSLVRIERRVGLSSVSSDLNSGALRASFRLGAGYGSCRCVEIVRGRVPVHSVRKAGYLSANDAAPFVHTTDMRATSKFAGSAASRLADYAPLIVISRVGQWRPPRVIDVGQAVLSDCVIGLRPRKGTSIVDLAKVVRELEPMILSEYRGTGAPYLTLARLSRVLAEAGLNPQVVKASSAVAPCNCSTALGGVTATYE